MERGNTDMKNLTIKNILKLIQILEEREETFYSMKKDMSDIPSLVEEYNQEIKETKELIKLLEEIKV